MEQDPNEKIGGYLTQEEIDQLLRAISPGIQVESITSPASLGSFLFNEIKNRTGTKGMFKGPHLVLDRSFMREAYTRAAVVEPASIIKIGSIEIFPVNVCPFCGSFTSDTAVGDYFRSSTPSASFLLENPRKSPYEIRRLWKTRVETLPCPSCGKVFQPSTVISDSSDNVAMPSYCRYQTIQHLVDWFISWTGKQMQLFSVKTHTVRFTHTHTTLFWDVFLHSAVKGFENCPPDISVNILKYTPFSDIKKMLEGAKGVSVFGAEDFSDLYSSTMVFPKN